MANGQLRGDVDLLAAFHARLSAHFAALSAKRRGSSGRPLFALEHSLDHEDLARLKSSIKSVIGAGYIPGEAEWLTLVIYAAEVGYGFSGDEYWHTFERDTPGWVTHGHRHIIRRRFYAFCDQFGGAVPTGSWAEHFSIISWPITHAVLPKDLQRHLVRLLFEFRQSLSISLLEDPELLGQKLAVRAAHTSSRFRNFAQNTDLLGQVSIALLTGEEGSAFLLDSTLHRIVGDLSRERQLREWLNQAKRTTVHIQTRGFKKSSGTTTGEKAIREHRRETIADPELLVRVDETGWIVLIKLPDLSGLEERLPGLYDELERKRCKLAGVAQPLARSWVLYPGRALKLDRMPKQGESLLSIENGSPQAQSLLSEQVVLTAEPWLFRLASDFSGVEVRGKFVRPGQSYLLLRTEELPDLPAMFERVHCPTQGMAAWLFTVPDPIEAEMVSTLSGLGLGIAHDIQIRPVGFCAAAWDGEGVGEWVAGETPIVGISSTQAVSRCVVNLDSSARLIPWEEDAKEMFLALNHLEVGNHNLSVSLISPEQVEISSGEISIRIRSQRDSTVGTFGQVLRLLSFPAHPTLADLWEGSANLQILGPIGVQATVTCWLAGRNPGEILASESFRVSLPCSTATWSELFHQGFRKSNKIQNTYDVAEACEIAVRHPVLGRASLRIERPFSSIRWTIGADRNGPFARIVDNTESSNVLIEFFKFGSPDKRSVYQSNLAKIRIESGGLLKATAGTAVSSVILPPTVRNFDDLRRAYVIPRLDNYPRTVEAILRLIALARMWTEASLPGNILADDLRDSVLRAITGNIVRGIAGQSWWQLEKDWNSEGYDNISKVVKGVGNHYNETRLAEDLARRLDGMVAMSPDVIIGTFVNKVSQNIGLAIDREMADLLLRFARSPSLVRGKEDSRVRSMLRLILERPVMLRTARLIVLGLDARTPPGTSHPLGV